jgi:phage-related protein
VFFGIGLTILFGLIKKVYESKKNVAFGIIAVSLVFLGTFYQVADSLTDLIAAIVFQTQHSGTDPSEYLIPSILKFATLVALTLVCFGPSIKAKCLPIRNLLSLRK